VLEGDTVIARGDLGDQGAGVDRHPLFLEARSASLEMSASSVRQHPVQRLEQDDVDPNRA